MTFVFEMMSKLATAVGVTQDDAKKSLKWFRDRARLLTGVDGNNLMRSDPDRILQASTINETAIGKMLLYYYDPKTKDRLPYYDRFPCIFVVDLARNKQGRVDGFYGINLHYISPYQRAKLMDALYKTNNNQRNLRYRLNISYQILKGASQMTAFRPCFKRYLYTHVRSRFFVVRTEEWDVIAMLPLARWERGGKGGGKVGSHVSQRRIFSESKAMMG